MPTIRNTIELIRTAEQILARYGFPNATVFQLDKTGVHDEPVLSTRTSLIGAKGLEAADEIVLQLGVQFDGEGDFI